VAKRASVACGSRVGGVPSANPAPLRVPYCLPPAAVEITHESTPCPPWSENKKAPPSCGGLCAERIGICHGNSITGSSLAGTSKGFMKAQHMDWHWMHLEDGGIGVFEQRCHALVQDGAPHLLR